MAEELDPITEQEVATADQVMASEQLSDEAEAVHDIAAVEEAEVEQAAEVVANAAETEEAVDEVGLTEEAEADLSDQPIVISKTIPDFRAGDTLRLGLRIKEGEKTRTQYFEGIVLARKGAGVNKTFTIRKIGAGGIAVERIFPVYSPAILSYEVRRRGVVRRAKIYFLRDIVGSTANVIKERKVVKEMQQVQEARSARKAVKAEKKAAKPSTVKKTKIKTTTRSAKRATKKS